MDEDSHGVRCIKSDSVNWIKAYSSTKRSKKTDEDKLDFCIVSATKFSSETEDWVHSKNIPIDQFI